MELRRRTRPAWEYSVFVLVVGCTLWLSLALYAKRDQVYKEKLLMQELETLRSTTTAYILEHRKHPTDAASTIDPFGGAYAYDARTGRISSTTPSYKNW